MHATVPNRWLSAVLRWREIKIPPYQQILSKIRTRAGDIFSEETAAQDAKRIAELAVD